MSGAPRRADVAFTPAVQRAQARRGSREPYDKALARRDWPSEVSEELAAFIAERDSFYFGTASAEGQPYIQHRGGPRGFLKVLDRSHLAFADYAGNRQYISVGNLDENSRAFLFLMDYPHQKRVKLWGHGEVVEDDPALLARVTDLDYDARPERAIVFRLEAWDANCRQHIVPRYTVDELPPELLQALSQGHH